MGTLNKCTFWIWWRVGVSHRTYLFGTHRPNQQYASTRQNQKDTRNSTTEALLIILSGIDFFRGGMHRSFSLHKFPVAGFVVQTLVSPSGLISRISSQLVRAKSFKLRASAIISASNFRAQTPCFARVSTNSWKSWHRSASVVPFGFISERILTNGCNQPCSELSVTSLGVIWSCFCKWGSECVKQNITLPWILDYVPISNAGDKDAWLYAFFACR